MTNVHNKTNATQKDHLAMQCKGECATQGGSHWVGDQGKILKLRMLVFKLLHWVDQGKNTKV